MAGDLLTLTTPLHISLDHPWMPRPAESHAVFGAGFILIASLLAVEGLAGGVWHRSMVRSLFFPAVLVMLGLGMVAVTYLEPQAKLAHFAMGMPLALGGWAEAQVRFGRMSRRVADIFIILGLLFAALETSLFHLNGSPTDGVFLTHGTLVVGALVVAMLRLYQSANPAALHRTLLIAFVVALVGVDLFVDAMYQQQGPASPPASAAELGSPSQADAGGP